MDSLSSSCIRAPFVSYDIGRCLQHYTQCGQHVLYILLVTKNDTYFSILQEVSFYCSVVGHNDKKGR